jgi:hypothetical protein
LAVRQVRRLLQLLRRERDKALIHKLRGRASNRKTSQQEREQIVRILSQDVYQGFGSTLASEYLAKKQKVTLGREALRQIMIAAGLWRACRQQNRESTPVGAAAQLPRGVGAVGYERASPAGSFPTPAPGAFDLGKGFVFLRPSVTIASPTF